MERAGAIGARVMERFRALGQKYPYVGDVRGLGAMNATEVVLDKKNPKPNADLAKAIVRRCFDKGLILLTAGVYETWSAISCRWSSPTRNWIKA